MTKEKLGTIYSLTDKLYFDHFAVYRRTISAYFEHPLLKKTLLHKFHIAHLEEYKNPEVFKKRLKDFSNSLDKTDPTEELNLLNIEPKDRTIYFIFEMWDGKKRLPLYYSAMYTRDCFDTDCSTLDSKKIGKIKWLNYLNACREELSGYIYDQTVHPSCAYDLFYLFHEFGFYVYEWLDKENPEHIDEPLDPSWLESCKRKFKQFKEPLLRNYALAVLGSVFKKANQDQEVMQCQFCGRYIYYVKNKLFCSLVYERRDCAKKARNKRYYSQKGRHRLDIYRNATKQLRAFYKEKNIKK